MSKPEITEKAGVFQFHWNEEHLDIKVSRLRQHRDERVTGEVLITTDAKGYAPLLHRSQINFTAARTMKELANILGEKYKPVEGQAGAMIDQLCYFTLEKVRQGEPVIELWSEDEDITPPQYLIKPLLPENQPTMIFGEPGTGKSQLAILASITLSLPWFDNPLGWEAPERPVPNLILDWETNENILKWRLSCLRKGMGLPPVKINYRHCVAPLTDDIEQIQEKISETGAEAIIIDSLTWAAGGDIMNPQTATAFGLALRQLNISCLIIGQTQKDPEAKVKTVLGTVIFQYCARSLWEVRRAQAPGEHDIHIALHHRKANESMRFRPLSYHIYFNEDKTTVSRENIKDVPEFREDMKTQEKVLIALQELGQAKAELIAEGANVSLNQAQIALSRLKKTGKVISLPDHTWGVVTKEFET